MGTGRYNLLDIIAIQYLNVRHGLHLEQKLIAGAPGRIASTAFFRTQYGELDANMVQDTDKSNGHTFVAVVE